MSNVLNTNFATNKNESDTNKVTASIANTNCIVCGSEFDKTRVGKLYCSNKCKQFGYNHKSEIIKYLETKSKGINSQPMIFAIDDYATYNKKQKLLKRFKELSKKKTNWETTNEELNQKDRLGIKIQDYLLDSYSKSKLTENEEGEFFDLEMQLDEGLLHLNSNEFSLEQWSFLKYLYPSVDEQTFFQIASSLSKEFLAQLSLSDVDELNSNVHLVIRNRFINHCNLIASGIIQFFKKPDDSNNN